MLAGGELDLQPSCLSALLSLAWGLGAALVPQTTCPLPGRKGKGARSLPVPQGMGHSQGLSLILVRAALAA